MNIHSTKAISLPVLPPTLPNAFRAPDNAPLIAGPADEVTLDNPCEALEVADEAVSFAFEAVSDAVEACLRFVLRPKNRDCRKTAREEAIEVDISPHKPTLAEQRTRAKYCGYRKEDGGAN